MVRPAGACTAEAKSAGACTAEVRLTGACTAEVKSAEACTAGVRSAEASIAVAKSAEACAAAIAAWRTMRRALRAVGWSVLSVLSGLVGVTLAGDSTTFTPLLWSSVYAVATWRGLKAVWVAFPL